VSDVHDLRGARIYTVGHSTRSLDELVAMLRAFGVAVLADIRTIPRSRHNPQFNEDALEAALPGPPLRYVHLSALGGLRRTSASSPNTGWRNASFRGFADYMQTEAFDAGLDELRALSAEGPIALMCAEAVPFRCHRSLVADALTVRGAHVEHIASAKRATPHRMTPFASVRGERITYPAEDLASADLEARGPFHLEATVRVLQRRPTNPVDVWEDGRYVRALRTSRGLALVEVENRGPLDEPALRFVLRAGDPSPEVRAEIAEMLRRVLGLDVDPAPLARLAGLERGLRPTARALRGMRPPRFAGLFETFANVLPFQQLSLDAGLAVAGRIVARFGERLELEGRRYLAFPTAARVAGARLDALRRCGLSGRKAESLRALARMVEGGELREDAIAAMPTEDALRALIELPGIGPWSAALVLLRGFRRLDVFPPGDVGAARGLRALMHLAPDADLHRVVERFGARRGYLYFYALGGSLLAKGLIHPAEPERVERVATTSRSA
jgi:DNA-3-methyladenine glycosylase II